MVVVQFYLLMIVFPRPELEIIVLVLVELGHRLDFVLLLIVFREILPLRFLNISKTLFNNEIPDYLKTLNIQRLMTYYGMQERTM